MSAGCCPLRWAMVKVLSGERVGGCECERRGGPANKFAPGWPLAAKSAAADWDHRERLDGDADDFEAVVAEDVGDFDGDALLAALGVGMGGEVDEVLLFA